MRDLDSIKIKPHPAKALLKEHGIPLSKTAVFLGCTYTYASHLLSGTCKPGKRIKRRLNELVKHLNAKE